MRRQKVWLPVGLLLVLVLALIGTRLPASAVGGNGLRVSPVRTDLTINAGQPQTIYITVTNVTTGATNLQAVVNDFIANPDESGNPALILNPNLFAPSHSLKRFIAPVGSFTLQPGEQKEIPITINVPNGAAGGGYYAAVRFGPPNSGTPNQTVSLAGSVGSLILVKVPGDIKEQLSIASFDARVKDRPSSFFTNNRNIAATIRLQNEGNIQEAPFGKVLLKNHSNKILATYELNGTTPPGNVLPDSIRKFSIPLSHVGSFGEFKIEGNFGYGNSGQLLSASTTFYVIPLWLILGFILLVILLVFLIFGLPRLVRAYNQRVLRRAGRR